MTSLSPKRAHLYTCKLDAEQADRLQAWVHQRGWQLRQVPHALYAYQKPNIQLTYYASGKLVLQGKGVADFVEFELDPQILHCAFSHQNALTHQDPKSLEPHAGMDECGKGDVFGPLVVACVVAPTPAIGEWIQAGIQDSKQLSDSRIRALAQTIRQTPQVTVQIMQCSMARYNELMAKPKANLNHLLAWLHARALEKALALNPVPWGLLDQFSKYDLVGRYLKKPDNFQLHQRTKAESDPVVAAASIVARAEFLHQMDKLSDQIGTPLPKGAGTPARQKAQALYETIGLEGLHLYAKVHFKTIQNLL